jgi:hypothetical protein
MKRTRAALVAAACVLGIGFLGPRAKAQSSGGAALAPGHYVAQGTDTQGNPYQGDVFVQANSAVWGDYGLGTGDFPFNAAGTVSGQQLTFTVPVPVTPGIINGLGGTGTSSSPGTLTAVYTVGQVTTSGTWTTAAQGELPSQDTWSVAPSGQPLAPTGLTAVFNEMAGQPDIAFRYPVDGCYARAQIMDDRMIGQGLTVGKVWSMAPDGEYIATKTPNYTQPYVEWGYHVASTVSVVQPDGTTQTMVIDPSLFTTAVTVQQWAAVQHLNSNLPPQNGRNSSSGPSFTGPPPPTQLTAWGQPPMLNNGTPSPSAYWPGAEPPEGDDASAAEVMEQYLPLQPPLPTSSSGH